MVQVDSSRRLRTFSVSCVMATLALAAGPSCGVDITYSADPLTAWIVDKDTGAPIEGVNVVAAWELKGGLEGGNVVGYVTVMETVTDTSGKFSFAAWGPKRHRDSGLVRSGAPLLIFFKSGYYSGARGNAAPTDAAPAHMHSDWHEKTIQLSRFQGSLREYADSLAVIDILIDSLLSNDECNWKAIPKFLWAVEQQNRVFVASNVRQLRDLDYLSIAYDRKCGSLKRYVQEHGK